MNREILQEKLHKMQKDRSYRLFTLEGEDGVKSMPALNGLSTYLILTGTEWFAKNGDQQMTSSQQNQKKVLFAETKEKLFLPTADETALYISPCSPASSCSRFAYLLIYENTVSAGFVGTETVEKYYTIQLSNADNNIFCLLDLVITAVSVVFPDDVDKLRTLFNLGSNYNAGDESIFEP